MAASFSRPGANVTGIFFDAPEIAGKWLQFLKGLAPELSNVGLLFDENTDDAQTRAAEDAAKSLRLGTVRLPVRTPEVIPDVLSRAAAAHVDGLLIHSSPIFVDQAGAISAAALKNKLPSIGLFPINARTGALLAYGPDNFALLPQAGMIVAKVLAGASPAELPIERPSRFKLVVNITTAQRLGLEIPPSFLLLADEIVE